MIWLETPTNPMLKITDIKKVCAIAKEAQVKGLCRQHLYESHTFKSHLIWEQM
jgi:O-acetylhomoserine/O-acetylserine sulfhydrylase-like pyridoxal-dependent enzyme